MIRRLLIDLLKVAVLIALTALVTIVTLRSIPAKAGPLYHWDVRPERCDCSQSPTFGGYRSSYDSNHDGPYYRKRAKQRKTAR